MCVSSFYKAAIYEKYKIQIFKKLLNGPAEVGVIITPTSGAAFLANGLFSRGVNLKKIINGINGWLIIMFDRQYCHC